MQTRGSYIMIEEKKGDRYACMEGLFDGRRRRWCGGDHSDSGGYIPASNTGSIVFIE